MEILSQIMAQMAAVRLPLYAVTVSAVPRPDTPVLMMLHWHGFRREVSVRTMPRAPLRPVPGSVLQLNLPWHRMEEIDAALLDAAWQLGAWDVERYAARACSQVGASERETLECRQAFGDNPFLPGDDSHMVAEAPDRGELMQMAALKGYVRWLFRPVRGGLWIETAEDETLGEDGGRAPPCPVAPQAPPGARSRRTVYRLGRTSRLLVR